MRPVVECSSREADLLHECLVFPERIFFVDETVLPVPDRAHHQLERLAGGQNRLAVARVHRLRKRSFHDPDHARPFACADFDLVFLDAGVRRISEHCLQVFGVLLNAPLSGTRPANGQQCPWRGFL